MSKLYYHHGRLTTMRQSTLDEFGMTMEKDNKRGETNDENN